MARPLVVLRLPLHDTQQQHASLYPSIVPSCDIIIDKFIHLFIFIQTESSSHSVGNKWIRNICRTEQHGSYITRLIDICCARVKLTKSVQTTDPEVNKEIELPELSSHTRNVILFTT